MYIQYIGKVLKILRLERKLSQFKVEIMCNLSHGTISRIENGAVNPTKETLFVIAKELKLNREELVQLFGIEAFLDSSIKRTYTS